MAGLGTSQTRRRGTRLGYQDYPMVLRDRYQDNISMSNWCGNPFFQALSQTHISYVVLSNVVYIQGKRKNTLKKHQKDSSQTQISYIYWTVMKYNNGIHSFVKKNKHE